MDILCSIVLASAAQTEFATIVSWKLKQKLMSLAFITGD
jgi:hypothetical protein